MVGNTAINLTGLLYVQLIPICHGVILWSYLVEL